MIDDEDAQIRFSGPLFTLGESSEVAQQLVSTSIRGLGGRAMPRLLFPRQRRTSRPMTADHHMHCFGVTSWTQRSGVLSGSVTVVDRGACQYACVGQQRRDDLGVVIRSCRNNGGFSQL